jgi:ferredoxin
MDSRSNAPANPAASLIERLFGRRSRDRLDGLQADISALVGAFSGYLPPPLIRSGVRPSRFPPAAPQVAERPGSPAAVATDHFQIRVIPGGEDAARAAPDVATGLVTVIDGAARHVFPRGSGQSILEAAEAHGLDLVHSCRAGGCAACRMRLVAGRVALPESHCLNARELAAGHILACVGCSDGDVTLEVE